jgi:hypothetical protein
MSAYDFVARAIAWQAAASSGLTFQELGRTSPGASRIDSSGFNVPGQGRGTYVADELADQALFEAHRRAVFVSANGRYFRLAGDERGFVTPEQFGCPAYASGVNQQPFIQAAIAYAEAAGLNGVLFAQPRYELWAPVRPDGVRFGDPAGSYLAIRRSVALVGTGPARVVLDCRNSQGGRNDTLTQKVSVPGWPEEGKAAPAWIGHGVHVDPAAAVLDHLRMENIEIDCTVTYNPNDRSNANPSNCGLSLGDNVRSVRLRDVTIRNCAGILYSYAGRTGAKEELLENCVFDGSPEGALRCGLAARGTYSNLQAGNAHRSQIFGGHGHALLGCRLYDTAHVMVLGRAGGGADGCKNGMADTYPLRATGSSPPTCVFQDLLAEKIGSFEVGAHVRGRLRTIDTSVLLANHGKLEDVDLAIESWADRRTDFDAVSIEGPLDLVTPVPGTLPGTTYALPRNLKIHVSCHRTAEAVSTGNAVLNALRFRGGLLDEGTVSFSLSGTARAAYDVSGTLPREGADPQTHRGFAWPTIIVEEGFALINANAVPNTATPAGAFDFALRPGPVNAVAPSAEGVHDMALVNIGRYVDGQFARIRHLGGSAGEGIVRLAQSGAGAQLPEDRHLIQKGDYIDLRWNAAANGWAESGYSTGYRTNREGSLTLPSSVAVLANAAASIDIAVPGASMSDRVTHVSWSGTATGPLQISPTVSSSDVVTVHLFNPSAQTVTIPKGAVVQASIRKAFGNEVAMNPVLGTLTLSSTAAIAGSAWTATIGGRTSGSTITASSSDGTVLTVSGDTVSGTFTSAGSKTVTLTETLAGATSSPRSSTANLAVAAPVTVGAESTALFAAMSTAPSEARRGRLNQLIERLKAATDSGATASIWSKLDVFFMFAASDEQAALLDWKRPAGRAATRAGAPVFTPGKGFAGLNTATDFLDLNYNPSGENGAQSLGIGRDDGHASVYALNEGTTTTGALADGQRLNVRARNGTRALIRLNSSGNTSLGDNVATPCSVTAIRSSAAEQLAYRNGSLVATGPVSSSGVPGAMTLLKSTDQLVASVSVGKALTAAQVAEYHAARLEYLQGIASDANDEAQRSMEPELEPTPTPTPDQTPAPPPSEPTLPSLPAATIVPPTLVGPWEPMVNMSSSSIINITPEPEDHLLLTRAQLTTSPADRRIKVQDGAVVRAEGLDMGGYELSIRGREHVSFIGVFSDNRGRPESDGSAVGCPGSDRPENPLAARPTVLYQYCRFVNFKGTDKDHFAAGGVDNVTRLVRIENLPDRRFRFILEFPFPEGIPPGPISPVRKLIVAEATHAPTGTNLPLQGNNWNYELDTAIDALTYEGAVQALGKERWSADTRLVPAVGDVSTGGRAWLCKTVAGQHSDSMFQVEDERPVGHLRVENCVTSGNYQVPGIIGSPGSPFTIRNLHAFKIFAAPQDPTTQNLYVKGSETGHFEGCFFEMQFGRPLAFYSVYPRTAQVSTDQTMAEPNLTYTSGGRFTGQIIDGPPPADFAPASLIGGNWKSGNYPGRTIPVAGDLQDIALRLDPLSASMTAGQRVGIIDVVHSTQGEIIELEIVGDTANIAGVIAKPGTKLIRRGLVVGTSRLAAGAIYTITVTARLRSNASISLQKTFQIAVP